MRISSVWAASAAIAVALSVSVEATADSDPVGEDASTGAEVRWEDFDKVDVNYTPPDRDDIVDTDLEQATTARDVFVLFLREGSTKISNSILYGFELNNNQAQSTIAAIRIEGTSLGRRVVHLGEAYNSSPASHVRYEPTSPQKAFLILSLALQKEVDIGRPPAVVSGLVGSSGIKCQSTAH